MEVDQLPEPWGVPEKECGWCGVGRGQRLASDASRMDAQVCAHMHWRDAIAALPFQQASSLWLAVAALLLCASLCMAGIDQLYAQAEGSTGVAASRCSPGEV